MPSVDAHAVSKGTCVMTSAIAIRPVYKNDQFQQVVALQKIYWGEDDAALVPTHMLASIVGYGGHVHAAFDEDRMVGTLIGFLGADIDPDSQQNAPSRMLIMSKRMIVLPEYRGHKIGERLKLAQRDYALQHGIRLVSWTFDPLLAPNAYLNLHKLAGLGQGYVPNFFGTGAVHPTLSEDRIKVNWWVDDDLTRERLAGQTIFNTADAPVINPAEMQKGLLIPTGKPTSFDEKQVLLQIPPNHAALQNLDAGLARSWRDHVRECFMTAFEQGYQAVDFVRRNDQTYYVLAQLDNPPHFADDLVTTSQQQ